MKKTALLIAAALLVLPTTAFALDITINDNMNPSSNFINASNPVDVRGIDEDSEVELNCVTGQKWDLEAVVWSPEYVYDPVNDVNKFVGASLTLVGGWDFIGSIDNWTSGDLFLAFDTKPLYGDSDIPPIGGNANIDVANTFGYDYALDTNWGAPSTFAAVDLNQNSPVLTKTVYYNQNEGADPWKLSSGGQITDRGFVSLASYETDAALWAAYGELDHVIYGAGTAVDAYKHYTATFDVTSIVLPLLQALPDEGVLLMWTHFTQQCGNDNLMGYVEIPKPENIVPEPSTMALLLLGLLGTFARKLRS